MGDSKNKKGCVHKLVMNLEPTSCPPDFLHMKKGIITKLINQIVDWVILQGKEEKLIGQMKEHRIPFTYVDVLAKFTLRLCLVLLNKLYRLFLSLYREENNDGTNSGVKWSTPNIHDLMKILLKIKIDLILDNVVDKRMTRVDDLPVVQLRDECEKLNLDKKGNKVKIILTAKQAINSNA